MKNLFFIVSSIFFSISIYVYGHEGNHEKATRADKLARECECIWRDPEICERAQDTDLSCARTCAKRVHKVSKTKANCERN